MQKLNPKIYFGMMIYKNCPKKTGGKITTLGLEAAAIRDLGPHFTEK
jgi:hypothetical protein